MHLVERRAARARFADPDGDREHRPGRADALRRARALGDEDEARQVGARFGRHGHVLLARQAAHLDERPRQQVVQLRRRIRRLHQRRADEDRVCARELGGCSLRPRPHAALGDRDPVGRDARHELQLRLAVDLERREVTGVDADHRSLEDDRALELVGVVRFDERVEAELVRQPSNSRT